MVDKIVFLGDYVDAFDKTDEEITTNLLNVIEFKKSQPEKVELLLGNHDIQYIYGYSQYGCSGFRPNMFASWNHLFSKNEKLFKIAYQYRNYLFTHAGVSSGWMRKHQDTVNNVGSAAGADTLAGKLNAIAMTGSGGCLHAIGDLRGGYAEWGGVTWADIRETSRNPLEHYHQIVGHSKIKEPCKVDNGTCSVTYIDVLDKVDQYLLLTDDGGQVTMKMVHPSGLEFDIRDH